MTAFYWFNHVWVDEGKVRIYFWRAFLFLGIYLDWEKYPTEEKTCWINSFEWLENVKIFNWISIFPISSQSKHKQRTNRGLEIYRMKLFSLPLAFWWLGLRFDPTSDFYFGSNLLHPNHNYPNGLIAIFPFNLYFPI